MELEQEGAVLLGVGVQVQLEDCLSGGLPLLLVLICFHVQVFGRSLGQGPALGQAAGGPGRLDGYVV